MRYKGRDYRPAPHLTWRFYNKDLDATRHLRGHEKVRGKVSARYCVIVSVKEAEKNGDDDGVNGIYATPCVKFTAWSRPNLLFGKARKDASGVGYTVPMYAILKGRVYQTSFKPDDAAVEHFM